MNTENNGVLRAEDVMSAEDFYDEARHLVTFMSCKDYEYARSREVDHVVLDVRSQEEFEAGHIEEAMNIPRGDLEFKISALIPNKSTPIIVYCKSGRRAALAALTLQKMGFSNVRVLEDGYDGYCGFIAKQ